MNFELRNRESFSICGYCTETCVENCGPDLSKLFGDFEEKKKELFAVYGARRDLYGLMWKTAGNRYCYLVGIEADEDKAAPAGAVQKLIPPAQYAVASVPESVGAVEAWTEYYYKVLPEAGLTPNAGHGFDFEYYPNGLHGDYEMWTPVTKETPGKR